MAKLKDVIYLSNEDYDTLVSTGTVTIDGDVLTYDESNVYITPEVMASSSQDGLMSAADKVKLDGIEAEMANYLPLTGGTLSLANSDSLKIKRTAANGGAFLTYYNNNQDTTFWRVGMANTGEFWLESNANYYPLKISRNGNMTMKGANISYAGSQATLPMIKFLDNTANNYGNGIAIGGGGIVVVGAGESSSLNYGAVGDENLHLAADSAIYFYSNADGGLTNACKMIYGVTGNLEVPGSIKEAGIWLADKYAAKSHTHDYVSSVKVGSTSYLPSSGVVSLPEYALSNHLYHYWTTNTYYYDDYSGTKNFRIVTENALADTLRFQASSIGNKEYWDYGTSTWKECSIDFSNLFDGRFNSQVAIPYDQRKFRFTINANSGWPTTALIILAGTWYNSGTISKVSGTDAYAVMQIETRASASDEWSSRVTVNYPNNCMGTNAFCVSSAVLHNGSLLYRITVELGSWVNTSNSAALTKIGILSNFNGSSLMPLSWSGTGAITARNSFYATTIYEHGTSLSSKYLGISAKAADSSKLNGQEASYYLNYNNFTNKPTLGTAAAANTGTSSGNVPVLDSSGKLNSSVVPAIAITDTFVVNSQSAMLALSAQVGDVCVRTDLKKSFILKTAGASTLANWQELLTPTDAVSSVNGKTGAVTLSASDVGALPSSTTFVSSVNGASGAITNVAKTNTANTFTGNNVFSGAFSATDGGSISDSSGTSLSVAGGSIDMFADSGVNIASSSRGYVSAAEPIRYTTGVGPIESQDLVQKSYVDNKTYATSIATSSGTNQLTLAFGTKYALTAGGTSYVFTMPSNPNTNQTVKAGSTTFGANAAVAIAAGTRITVTPNATNNTITIATSATADSAITNAQIDGLF